MNNTSKHTLYSLTSKMSDVILDNYEMLTVLPRFSVQLGFGEQTISRICQRYKLDPQFFLMVCNVYTHPDYLPSSYEITAIDLEALMGYLQRSHQYYLTQRIATVEKKLSLMSCDYAPEQSQIINTFFSEYKREVENHFHYEEQQVFPYIRSLQSTHHTIEGFNIARYEQNHSNIEDKLSDLKNIIIKYLPESCTSSLRNDVLFEIFAFEQDLIKHSLIEDKILVPYVIQLEKQYDNQ